MPKWKCASFSRSNLVQSNANLALLRSNTQVAQQGTVRRHRVELHLPISHAINPCTHSHHVLHHGASWQRCIPHSATPSRPQRQQRG